MNNPALALLDQMINGVIPVDLPRLKAVLSGSRKIFIVWENDSLGSSRLYSAHATEVEAEKAAKPDWLSVDPVILYE